MSEFNTLFVVEWRPERFLLGVADVHDTREARLYEVDLNGWSPGEAMTRKRLLTLPQPWSGLNGGCLIGPDTLLAGMAGLIWRIDLADGAERTARIWLQHDSMKNRPGEKKPEQPGTNGVQCDAGGRQWDDLLIDGAAGMAYCTTHCENTVDCVMLAHNGNREGRRVVAGDPFADLLVGPSAGAWGRAPGDRGRIADFLTDGGTASPPDGKDRTAKLLRVAVPPVS